LNARPLRLAAAQLGLVLACLLGQGAAAQDYLDPKEIQASPQRFWLRQYLFKDVLVAPPAAAAGIDFGDLPHFQMATQGFKLAYATREAKDQMQGLAVGQEYLFQGTVQNRRGKYYFTITDVLNVRQDPNVVVTPEQVETLRIARNNEALAQLLYNTQAAMLLYSKRNGVPFKELFNPESPHSVRALQIVREVVASYERTETSPAEILTTSVKVALEKYYGDPAARPVEENLPPEVLQQVETLATQAAASEGTVPAPEPAPARPPVTALDPAPAVAQPDAFAKPMDTRPGPTVLGNEPDEVLEQLLAPARADPASPAGVPAVAPAPVEPAPEIEPVPGPAPIPEPVMPAPETPALVAPEPAPAPAVVLPEPVGPPAEPAPVPVLPLPTPNLLLDPPPVAPIVPDPAPEPVAPPEPAPVPPVEPMPEALPLPVRDPAPVPAVVIPEPTPVLPDAPPAAVVMPDPGTPAAEAPRGPEVLEQIISSAELDQLMKELNIQPEVVAPPPAPASPGGEVADPPPPVPVDPAPVVVMPDPAPAPIAEPVPAPELPGPAGVIPEPIPAPPAAPEPAAGLDNPPPAVVLPDPPPVLVPVPTPPLPAPAGLQPLPVPVLVPAPPPDAPAPAKPKDPPAEKPKAKPTEKPKETPAAKPVPKAADGIYDPDVDFHFKNLPK
jgi:hypothetical protein